MTRLNAISIASLFTFCMCSFSFAETPVRLRPGEELRKQVGSTDVYLAHNQLSADEPKQLLSATFATDKDVRIARNDLPAGKYEVALEVAPKDHVHLVFRKGDEETFRYALRPERQDAIQIPTIRLDVEEPPPREGRRRRRRRREPSVEIQFRWSDKLATLDMQMTGIVWRSTPEPKLPDEFREPWTVVKSSLLGFVHQSMDEHVAHFAKDFESDWDDGGSQEAHVQMIGRMLFEGEFEDTVLKLDQLQWKATDGRVIFRGIVVQAPAGTFPLVYTVEKRNDDWKIVHLDGPKL